MILLPRNLSWILQSWRPWNGGQEDVSLKCFYDKLTFVKYRFKNSAQVLFVYPCPRVSHLNCLTVPSVSTVPVIKQAWTFSSVEKKQAYAGAKVLDYWHFWEPLCVQNDLDLVSLCFWKWRHTPNTCSMIFEWFDVLFYLASYAKRIDTCKLCPLFQWENLQIMPL